MDASAAPNLLSTPMLNLRTFGIDTRTGFLPRNPPLRRLPPTWEPWEVILEGAVGGKVKLGAAPDLTEADAEASEAWRERVRQLLVLPIEELKESEVLLRRAHHVLTYILHFFVHSLPPHDPVAIPLPLSLPLLHVSKVLGIPPTMSYSDDVLHNWKLKSDSGAGGEGDLPTLGGLSCQTSFTGSADEEEFYLSAARVELHGAVVLELMQSILCDLSPSTPNLAAKTQRITTSLTTIASTIAEMRTLLLAVRDGCDPGYFFREIRPWLVGTEPAQDATRPWVFEGLEGEGLEVPTELSGSSAAQSTLVQGLDVFLGVDAYLPAQGEPRESQPHATVSPFAERMRLYMPRQHREFLAHLRIVAGIHPLREFVASAGSEELVGAYNAAIHALKEFRGAHMIIVTLYIIGPGRRAGRAAAEAAGEGGGNEQGKGAGMALRGSAGGDLARLLKDFRDRTKGAVLPEKS